MRLRKKLVLVPLLILLFTTFSQKIGSGEAADCKIELNEISFMGKCFCKPGWESSADRPSLKCDKPLLEHGNCQCGLMKRLKSGDTEIVKYKNPADHNKYLDTVEALNEPEHLRCYHLCRYNSEIGMPISHPAEWKDNLYWKQIGFYTKELRLCSLNIRHTHMRGRLDEFADSFSNFEFLKKEKTLGNVIEFGAGGYTQLRNMLEHQNITIDKVTLVDPLLTNYARLEGCSYADGNLIIKGKPYETKLINTSVEVFGHDFLGPDVLLKKSLSYAPENVILYDTVVVMNVLVYSRNAFEFLETVYRSLKPGGLLIFHDRWFDDVMPIERSTRCKMSGFLQHMIQVRKDFLQYFLGEEFFEQAPYHNSTRNEHQLFRMREWCPNMDDERAYFVALRKK
tara:strand:- start:740 stop:1927 length:1188 start_codon:yes stop_codon:yes gene_type:complete